MRQAHSYLDYPSFFAVKYSFLQEDPLVSRVLPAPSSGMVACLTGLVLWYRYATGLVNEMIEARQDNRLSVLMR